MKTILIAGITGSIGQALAQTCLQQGYTVAGYARPSEKLTQLSDSGDYAQVLPCDATHPDALKNTIQQLQQTLSFIDAYAHAIGSILLKPAHLTKDADWQHTLETNLYSAFYALRSIAPIMQKQRSGSMLFYSSVAAQIGLASHEAIAAAKAGIQGLVLSASASYAAQGLRINAIAPGLVDTKLSAPLLSSEPARKISQRMHPLGRIGTASEIAQLSAWLLSEQASWMTGQTLSLDGGMSRILPKPKA